MPDDEINKITHLNAMRNFQFDPFAHRPREQCTVGALRAEATDVDITVRSSGIPVEPAERPVRIADIAAMSGSRT